MAQSDTKRQDYTKASRLAIAAINGGEAEKAALREHLVAMDHPLAVVFEAAATQQPGTRSNSREVGTGRFWCEGPTDQWEDEYCVQVWESRCETEERRHLAFARLLPYVPGSMMRHEYKIHVVLNDEQLLRLAERVKREKSTWKEHRQQAAKVAKRLAAKIGGRV